MVIHLILNCLRSSGKILKYCYHKHGVIPLLKYHAVSDFITKTSSPTTVQESSLCDILGKQL